MSKLYNPVSVNILRRDGSFKGFCHCWLVTTPSAFEETKAYNVAPAKLTYRKCQKHHLEGRQDRQAKSILEQDGEPRSQGPQKGARPSNDGVDSENIGAPLLLARYPGE